MALLLSSDDMSLVVQKSTFPISSIFCDNKFCLPLTLANYFSTNANTILQKEKGRHKQTQIYYFLAYLICVQSPNQIICVSAFMILIPTTNYSYFLLYLMQRSPTIPLRESYYYCSRWAFVCICLNCMVIFALCLSSAFFLLYCDAAFSYYSSSRELLLL